MSATFNTELFANYFSKSSIATIESTAVYQGVSEQYKKEETERKKKLELEWGAKNKVDWEALLREGAKTDLEMEEDDEWVEEREDS